MNGPARLRDEGMAAERALLNAASKDGLSREAKDRMASALGLGAGAAASVSLAPAASKSISFTLVKWGLLSVAVIGMIWGGVRLLSSRSRVPPPAPPPAVSIEETPTAAPTASADVDLPPPEPSTSVEAHRVPAPSARASSLADEVAALEVARAAIARHDAAAALAAIARYEHDFPKRSLGPEATMLRIEALVQQGNRAAALPLAKRLLGANRTYEARIRTLFPELATP